MVLKKISQAIEDTVFIEAESLWMEHVLSQMGESNFKRLRNLPEEILDEMRGFIKRNSLAIIAYRIDGRKPLHCCCSRCLKAHLARKCREMGYDEHGKAVERMFDCEMGHDGYYVDNSELFKN
ncbi:MAG: hypothetical protein ABH864_02930 [archaeon]